MIHIKQAAEQQSYVDFTLLLYSSHQLTIIKRPVDVDTSLVSQVHCIGNSLFKNLSSKFDANERVN